MLKFLRYFAVLICVSGLAGFVALWVRGRNGIADLFVMPLPGSRCLLLENRYGWHVLQFVDFSGTPIPISIVMSQLGHDPVTLPLGVVWGTQTISTEDPTLMRAAGKFQWEWHETSGLMVWPCWLSVCVFAAGLAASLSGSRLFRRTSRRHAIGDQDGSER